MIFSLTSFDDPPARCRNETLRFRAHLFFLVLYAFLSAVKAGVVSFPSASCVERRRRLRREEHARVTPYARKHSSPRSRARSMAPCRRRLSVRSVSPQSKTMRYIGVSRGIQQSLRLCLARRPEETYYFKVRVRECEGVLCSPFFEGHKENSGGGSDMCSSGSCLCAWASRQDVDALEC